MWYFQLGIEKLEKPENECEQIVTPSLTKSMKLSDVKTSDTSKNDNEVIVGNNTDNECVHNRKGWCEVHEEYARKVCTTKKVWAKKKNGLFGNVIKKHTSYRCMGRDYLAQNTDRKNQDLSTISKPQNTAQKLGMGIQSAEGNSAGQYKCTVADSGFVGVGLPGGASQIRD